MIGMVKQQIEKAIRDNDATPFSIQYGGPQRVMLFRHRGIDMAMYADEINYKSVREHIQAKIKDYPFPMCQCGQGLPANYADGMKCIRCLRG